MYKSEQGHGICGAKNIYTTKTKVGNWVEDRIGMDLASTSRPACTSYQTVQAASHCHPSNWPEPPTLPVNVPSAQELKVKNKEGMPYSLLFEHGTKEIPPEERFKTAGMMLMARVPSSESLSPGKDNRNSLARKKSKQVLEDINLSYVKSTQNRQASAHLIFETRAPKVSIGKTEELPNFRRTNPLTSMYPNLTQMVHR